LLDRFEGLFGEEARGVGVEGMGLRDDGVAGGDGSGEVSSADAVEGEGKVVRTEDDDGADRSEAGADIFFDVEGCVTPGLLAHCGGSLAKLVGGAGEFDVFEARGDWKCGFLRRSCDDGSGSGFDVSGVGFEKGGYFRRVDGAEFGGGFGGGSESEINVGPSADWEGEWESFTLRGILGVEGSLCVGCAPFAVDQYLSYVLSCDLGCIHCVSLSMIVDV
jgi:hypothetical protein